MSNIITNIHALGHIITRQLIEKKKLCDLEYILEKYIGNDWISHTEVSNDSYYKTNVFTNEFIDIFIINWNSNQKSFIHDHPSAGCLMKVLTGSLIENLYQNDRLQLIQTNHLNMGNISYREGSVILHNIENRTSTPAVSIHIYSPPNYKINYY